QQMRQHAVSKSHPRGWGLRVLCCVLLLVLSGEQALAGDCGGPSQRFRIGFGDEPRSPHLDADQVQATLHACRSSDWVSKVGNIVFLTETIDERAYQDFARLFTAGA